MRQIILFFTLLLPLCLFAQLTETFNGPEINSFYPWEGDLEKFKINGKGELQLYAYQYTGNGLLYIPSAILLENEWHFTIRTEAACSSQNYFKIFLWSKKPDMANPEEALFIRLGYTNKNIALCKQTNNLAPEILFEGRRLFDQASEITIKVLTDVKGNCSIYSKTTKDKDFIFEGTAGQFSRDANGYFMLGAYYTAQHSRNKYFDNIYIRHYSAKTDSSNSPEGLEPSIDPLELLAIVQESQTELLLYFNKPVIVDEASFYLSDIGEISDIYISDDDMVIMLVSEAVFEKGKEYTITCSGLYDYDGDVYTFSKSFTASRDNDKNPDNSENPNNPDSSPRIIRINEIMANPKGLIHLPETEYVELYNASSTSQSLAGWSFIYDSKVPIPLKDLLLPVNSYVVLYREGREIHVADGGYDMPLSSFPAQLANTGKTLQLKNPSGQLIDEYTYETAKPAQSWEYTVQGWLLCSDETGGTPGKANSSSFNPDNPNNPDPVPSSFGTVRINEVMSNPKGLTAFPETEYVELYNTSSSIQLLSGWSFYYGDKATLLDAFLLPPDGYIVLYREGREIHIDEGGYGMPLAEFPAQLSNTGKYLKLTDATGLLIDEYTYPKSSPALSWEYGDTAWSLSTDERGGTPGSQNSTARDNSEELESPEDPDNPVSSEGPLILPGEIVFNELLPNPYLEGSEYIELYNCSNRSLSLSGLAIATRKSDGSLSFRYSLSSVADWLEPGGYALLTKDKSGVEPFYLISVPENLYELKLPILANTSSTLVLFRIEDEEIIDEVSYSSKWHASAIKEQKGVSLERIDPDKPTQSAENWTSASSTAGYGTPGYRNSQSDLNSGNIDGIDAPQYSESTDLYTILYTLSEPGYSCRIRIYNLFGQIVNQIVNHELLGTEGSFIWDGFGSNGNRLKAGIYIFHAELYHTNGNVKTFKKVFLVR